MWWIIIPPTTGLHQIHDFSHAKVAVSSHVGPSASRAITIRGSPHGVGDALITVRCRIAKCHIRPPHQRMNRPPPSVQGAPSALLFILRNDECYTLGPSHYADSVQFLHALDCTAHLRHVHSHSYSDANDVGPNHGTFGIIHAWWSNANGDRCITLSTGHPSTTTDCKSAAWAMASCPWLM